MYNFHPGSHVGQGVEVGTEYIIEMLNEIIKPEQTTKVLLETMAGKGSEIGKDFEEIKNIMNKIKLKDHIGVCLDTCHIFDGGYDIVNELDKVVEEFDKIIGLDKLYATKVYRTDEVGTILLTSDGKTYNIQTFFTALDGNSSTANINAPVEETEQ